MELYHSTILDSKLEMSGVFRFSGPQPVGEGGIPEYIANVFWAEPSVKVGAVQYELGKKVLSAIYQRMPPEST
jgi:hypothetical protein